MHELSVEDLSSETRPTWCGGCGNYPILIAVKKAIAQLGLDPDKVVIVSGIGCGSSFPHWVRTYGFHTIHGRPIPLASALKMANRELTVLVTAGDGDTYGIGANHFLHAMRRNLDITVLVQNNNIYGLTEGQASPTSELGKVTKSTPYGVVEAPLNPLAVALSAGATFVARAFSGNLQHLTEMVKAAIQHRGVALVDVLQPCVTFNPAYSYEFWRNRTYLPGQHDAQDIHAALRLALEEDRRALGVLYQVQKPTLLDMMPLPKEPGNLSRLMESFV
ncbi:2-oxoacid:ferredoxin oxidoreductase subunit beta [Candidatus Woesearchaeota archaeon]|nr:2-oxoacid:ferredoxin oxidoreductase subunit beta [Candidatus Woesearchaeota archaeon]